MTAKIRIKVGSVEVDYEGPGDFLDEKLYELVDKLSTLAENAPTELGGTDATQAGNYSETLPSFLQRTGVSTQKARFLATAQWLHNRAKNRLKTSDVTKALRDNNQSKLGNASDSLAKNISEGFCERDGDNFFVTEEGKSSLGYE